MRFGGELFEMFGKTFAREQVDFFETRSSRAPGTNFTVMFVARNERQCDRGSERARSSPKTNARIDEDCQRAGRFAHGRFATEIQRFVEGNPNRKREVVVREFAEQEPIKRPTIRDVR